MRPCLLLPFFVLAGIIIVSCARPVTPSAGESSLVNRARSSRLVDVRREIPDIIIDLRYATSDNILGQPVYPAEMPCLLHETTIPRLRAAQAQLRSLGYGLKIWDAWRPREAQETFFRKVGHTGMFLDPKEAWSRHCSGVSVDVTLVDLKGNELPMPSGHDEHSDKAYYQYSGNDPTVRRNVESLQAVMFAHGFTMIALEWWHFDDHANFFTPPPVVTAAELGIEMPLVP